MAIIKFKTITILIFINCVGYLVNAQDCNGSIVGKDFIEEERLNDIDLTIRLPFGLTNERTSKHSIKAHITNSTNSYNITILENDVKHTYSDSHEIEDELINQLLNSAFKGAEISSRKNEVFRNLEIKTVDLRNTIALIDGEIELTSKVIFVLRPESIVIFIFNTESENKVCNLKNFNYLFNNFSFGDSWYF